MITLLSTLVSFLAGGLPKFLDFMQDKSDKRQELEIMEMQLQREKEMAKLGFAVQERIAEIELAETTIKEDSAVKQAIYDHDKAIGVGASQWCINLRSSVRPIVTYAMLMLLAFVNIFGCFYAYSTDVPFQTAIGLLITAEFEIILASIISFWFGGKAFNRK